ncbi:hypothetical protein SADUNF_Sadunf14G0134900 [Salix dunnii]|uniref:Uncharacterized protein n=1 Tax=Salix dunnii TaxID=1413687 RepID=A0A835JJU3_9ROSI|nr:hypothetical protein SADUNF_Sadunf14G0134900 [Salix dunnii]
MNPKSNPFSAAGSGLIRGGLSAYGEKIFGSGSEYVQSNISKCFSDPQYYFQVNDHYVRNKLKIVLLPFLNRGHWTRITEPVGGKLSYEPPINDINAPDLYIPCMAFTTYLVLAGISLGLSGKFTPEALYWKFVTGMIGWFSEVMLLKVSILSLGGGEAPLLDMVAYAGYTFTGMCVAVLGNITLGYTYYLIILWTCPCMGIFFYQDNEANSIVRATPHELSFPEGSRGIRHLVLSGRPLFSPLHQTFCWLAVSETFA